MYLIPVHITESVGTKKKQILSNIDVYWIEFYCTHATNDLLVSFDGTSYRTVTAGTKWPIRAFANKPIHIDECFVKGSAAATTFEVVYLVEGN